ncbi:F-box domain-containing protein [Artemisia annua]|uniref:F-box domain-containing protein n=1 Tax=Artemisia annua TaxID=35608 RepID=A0A2U1LL00_ARTAN|nr:F-box domain-containing protein [Artemisia annua]
MAGDIPPPQPVILLSDKLMTINRLRNIYLEEKEEDALGEKTPISIPNDIIQEILSRLPVRAVLQFKSVSKQWLSLISHPSFHKLHSKHNTHHHTTLLITAYDYVTKKRHFLSAPPGGGPVTHLITLDNAFDPSAPFEAEHSNGLVLFSSRDVYCQHNFAFVINPVTRKVFKLPTPPNNFKPSIYFFGFDESKKEHKILSMSLLYRIMIFSLASYSWTAIDVRVDPDGLPSIIYNAIVFHRNSVCYNSIIHLVSKYGRLTGFAFDLRTEKLSYSVLPQSAVPFQLRRRFCVNNKDLTDFNTPLTRLSTNMITALVFDMNTRSYNFVNFTLGYQFLHSKTLHFNQVRSYVESLVPLREE